MSETKIFCTGVTGYIGGDAIFAIVKLHPEYDITCLVRNSDKGAQVASQYSKIKLVYGDLDNNVLLEEEARKADIVLHTANADHAGAAIAIARGISSRKSPGYFIHTSGTGILGFADLAHKTYGEAATKVYNDWDGVSEVTSLPDSAPHRNVDKIVLAAGRDNVDIVKTAIVCPPTIYGEGRGPGNRRSIQVPNLIKATLEKQEGVVVGAGQNWWTNIHVADLSQVYLRLVEEASKSGGSATWGEDGYYFTEREEFQWRKAAKAVASAAHKKGFISKDSITTVSAEEADRLVPSGSFLWGTNSRCKAVRANRQLAWVPEQRSIYDDIPDEVAREAKRLGLKAST